MGLLDKAFIDAGFTVIPGCEIEPRMRRMYELFIDPEPHLTHDLKDLPEIVQGQHFEGIIGGPPCQSHSRTKNLHTPKFPDATPLVDKLLQVVTFDWFLFENVTPVKVRIPGAKVCRMNAMHYGRPHQCRDRVFTFKNLAPPPRRFLGSADKLMAYPAVIGKLYGPKRGAVLQGYPDLANLPVSCLDLQLGLANAVPYQLGSAWARQAWNLHAPEAQAA
jgi:site-specific DNA-cytosine methylase